MDCITIFLELLKNIEASNLGHKQIIFTINNARTDISCGEAYMAFEDVVSNLYEFSAKLSVDDFEKIKDIAKYFDMDCSRYTFLSDLVE